jgi:hypothetical protein
MFVKLPENPLNQGIHIKISYINNIKASTQNHEKV